MRRSLVYRVMKNITIGLGILVGVAALAIASDAQAQDSLSVEQAIQLALKNPPTRFARRRLVKTGRSIPPLLRGFHSGPKSRCMKSA